MILGPKLGFYDNSTSEAEKLPVHNKDSMGFGAGKLLIDWVSSVFIDVEKEMREQVIGRMYEQYGFLGENAGFDGYAYFNLFCIGTVKPHEKKMNRKYFLILVTIISTCGKISFTSSRRRRW